MNKEHYIHSAQISAGQGRAIALGFFDGVHIGHSKLLIRTAEAASERGLTPCVFTFDRHPINEITGHPLPLLNTVEDRSYIIRKYCGISEVIVAHFDSALMHMPWRSFIHDMMADKYQAKYLVAGWDYRFGYKGEGDPKLLCAEAASLGIGCDIIPEVTLDGITVSSTYIRKLVADGEMEEAARFLGHPHILSGVVTHGMRLGRTLGVPTINITLPTGIQHPLNGVYASRVIVDDSGLSFPGVTNIGVKPTVTNSGEIVVEMHIIGFSGDLYGKLVRLELLKFMRPETRFADVDSLKNQLQQDIESARSIIENI